MNGAIASELQPFGAAGRLGIAAAVLGNQYAVLEAQASSGLVAPNVADLGPSTEAVLDLQPQLAAVDAWTGNVTVASNRLTVAQSALTGISALAASLSSTLSELVSGGGAEQSAAIAAAASDASASLQQLGSLLDTQSGDSYVFGGTDDATAPVADPASLGSGTLGTAIAAAIAGLPANGGAATTAAILSAATATSPGQPFSAVLGGTLPATGTIVVGAGESVAAGIAATAGTLAAPSSTSTGSPVRDLVAALAAVANLSPSSGSTAGFAEFVASLQQIAGGAVSGLADMAGQMGTTQDFLTDTASTYASLTDALTGQIGSLTSVDLPTVSTEMQQTSTALQTSYQLIADLKSLSLADYL